MILLSHCGSAESVSLSAVQAWLCSLRTRLLVSAIWRSSPFLGLTFATLQANVRISGPTLIRKADSLEVFAKADYDPAKPCVEAVLDSSRYFVVRVEDNGRRAYIGMGFLERSDSFDFSTSLTRLASLRLL